MFFFSSSMFGLQVRGEQVRRQSSLETRFMTACTRQSLMQNFICKLITSGQQYFSYQAWMLRCRLHVLNTLGWVEEKLQSSFAITDISLQVQELRFSPSATSLTLYVIILEAGVHFQPLPANSTTALIRLGLVGLFHSSMRSFQTLLNLISANC